MSAASFASFGASRSSHQASSTSYTFKMVTGIGLFFTQDEEHHNEVYVRTIMKGGSAEHDGTVRVGDYIVSVEKQNVVGKSVIELKSIIRGEIGSYVNLGFKRILEDGTESTYEVSLMRGQAEYIAFKEKTRLEQMLEQLRKQLQHSEVELEALRGALVRCESQTIKDKEEIARLTRRIDEITTQVKEQTNIITQMQSEKEGLESGRRGTSKDEIAELTKLLQEAGAHLNAAKESLEKDQKKTWELEDLYKREKAAREACEARIRKMEAEIEPRNEQERIYRENQEQLRRKLMESRDRLLQMLQEAQRIREVEIQRREQAEANDISSEERVVIVQRQNQEIQVRVKETERMLRSTEGARLEVLGRHESLLSDLSRVKNQAQVREQLIVDLQSRIEEDYQRWDIAVKTAKDNRRQDEERFREAESTLQDQINKLKNDSAKYESAISEVLMQLEQRRTQLVTHKEELERALQEQRNVSAQLREEVTRLTAKLQQAEGEVNATRADIARLENARRAHEQETSLSEQRRQAIETEYEMYLRKEQLRMDFVQEAQSMHAQALDDLEKQMGSIAQQRDEVLEEKSKIDIEIRRCSEAIKKFQELDRLRRLRADEFREKRYGALESFTELLLMQDGLRKVIDGIRKPLSTAVNFHDREIAQIAEMFPNAFAVDSSLKETYAKASLPQDIKGTSFTIPNLHATAPTAGEGVIHYNTLPAQLPTQVPMVPMMHVTPELLNMRRSYGEGMLYPRHFSGEALA